MKVILRKDVDGLGKRGDVINVKTGYARNKLIPQGLVFEYSKGNLKRFEEEKKFLKIQDAKNKKQAEELAEKLKEVSITISQKAHDNDELYGSVNQTMIAKELEEKGFSIDKSAILLDEHIKKIGVYEIQVRLHPEVTGTVKVWVVKDE